MGPENHSAHDFRLEEKRERLLTAPDDSLLRILDSLFDGDVVTEITDLAGPHAELHAAEAECIRGAHPNRIREFRAGRHCAHAALRRLGVPDAPLLRGSDRVPVWPAGVVGSLTHTGRGPRGFCAAAVATNAVYSALGLDAEFDEPLSQDLFRAVLNSVERSFLESRPDEERGRLAKLIFSAKESVYKCQYTMTRQFLGFDAVAIVLRVDDGQFTARFLRGVGNIPIDTTFEGRFVAANGLLVTATALRA